MPQTDDNTLITLANLERFKEHFTEVTVNFVSGSYSNGVLQLTPATTTVWVPNTPNN